MRLIRAVVYNILMCGCERGLRRLHLLLCFTLGEPIEIQTGLSLEQISTKPAKSMLAVRK
ncbi:MAG: hypothetical protein JW856_05380 [Dehalococcoidales bacterium]|nr:hypothetical protein [Dehalococcoidales bacterium]